MRTSGETSVLVSAISRKQWNIEKSNNNSRLERYEKSVLPRESPDELKEVVISCGSGIQPCHNPSTMVCFNPAGDVEGLGQMVGQQRFGAPKLNMNHPFGKMDSNMKPKKIKFEFDAPFKSSTQPKAKYVSPSVIQDMSGRQPSALNDHPRMCPSDRDASQMNFTGKRPSFGRESGYGTSNETMELLPRSSTTLNQDKAIKYIDNDHFDDPAPGCFSVEPLNGDQNENRLKQNSKSVNITIADNVQGSNEPRNTAKMVRMLIAGIIILIIGIISVLILLTINHDYNYYYPDSMGMM